MNGATHSGCKTKTSLDGLVFFWRYKGAVHKIIHKIKYNPFIFTAIEEIVNNVLLQCPSEALHRKAKGDSFIMQNPSFQAFLSQKPLLIPVPLHKSRLRYRGYNHAEKIAEAFGKNWHLKVIPNLLIRTRATKPQAKLKLEERKSNIKDAFAINNSNNSCGTRGTLDTCGTFILVDDVWTSGSTLSECCRVLKQKGAQKVWALTLAR